MGFAALLDEGADQAQRPINARSKTAVTSGMFKDALAWRRCLVPADAFYEWKVIEGGKPPFAIAPDVFHRFVDQRVPWMRQVDYDHMLDGLRKAGWQG